jgi:hypothetical protein
MEIVQGALEAVGPWIGSIAPLPLLFIALVRGWLLTPAAVQKLYESQETRIKEIKDSYEARIQESREREIDWKSKAEDALELVRIQQDQLEVVTELGETSAKLLEAVHGAKFGYVPEVRKTTHVVRPGRED